MLHPLKIRIPHKLLNKFRKFSESQQDDILGALEKIGFSKSPYYKMLMKAKYETDRFLSGTAFINGKRIDILGAVDEKGRLCSLKCRF